MKLRLFLPIAFAFIGMALGVWVLANPPSAKASGCNPPCQYPRPYCCINDQTGRGTCASSPCQ